MVKIAAVGDNVVDCYVSRDQMFPGGNCLNVSVFARRFGAQSAYIGAIGRDRAGQAIAAALQEEGVDTSHLRILDGRTAYCVVGHRGAERVFLTFDLGVSMFVPSEEDLRFLSDFSAVHVGQSSGLDAHLAAVAARAPLSYDFSVRRESAHRRAIGPLCFLASVSGGDMSAQEAEGVADELLGSGAQWVLVTRGRLGAHLFGRAGRFFTPAVAVEVLDTLGAGDTFIARTLTGLCGKEDPDAILRAASAAAADTCRYFGAIGHGAMTEIGLDVKALASNLTG